MLVPMFKYSVKKLGFENRNSFIWLFNCPKLNFLEQQEEFDVT